jgi:tetratricopeptide (TPR) repeat protein
VAFATLARGRLPAQTIRLSEAQTERLRSLGYLTTSPEQVTDHEDLSAIVQGTAADSLAVWYFPPGERGTDRGLPHPRDQVVDYNRKLKATSRYKQGKAALRAGDPVLAEKAFRRALEQDPNYPSAWFGLIQLYEDTGDRSQVIATLRQAQQACRADPAVLVTVAEKLIQYHRSSEARQILQEAIDRGVQDPKLNELLRSIGQTHR